MSCNINIILLLYIIFCYDVWWVVQNCIKKHYKTSDSQWVKFVLNSGMVTEHIKEVTCVKLMETKMIQERCIRNIFCTSVSEIKPFEVNDSLSEIRFWLNSKASLFLFEKNSGLVCFNIKSFHTISETNS